MCRAILLLIFTLLSNFAIANSGYNLWLPSVENQTKAAVKSSCKGETAQIAKSEIERFWRGGEVTFSLQPKREISAEGFQIESKNGKTTISASSEVGLLYGAYDLLRRQECGLGLNFTSEPAYNLRMLNHWDNLDGTVERGYAGRSIWKWEELPQTISPRYSDYARANASIGINATVLNNVNATPQILTAEYLRKVKAIAEVLRPYGIKVFLSINFSSPKVLGGLENSDPLNPQVHKWWQHKVKEIYELIPDFGGFLVKANSEGLPGPQDYGRTHADGANMLAEALAPYKGVVLWRAFVYNSNGEDRAKQAYQEFMPLDGQFADNVIIQVKNGPVDFQPREPFTPLFGAMKTPLAVEFQITQEYLGFSNHLVFLAPLYRETLNAYTYCDTTDATLSNLSKTTIANITIGKYSPHTTTAIAGVANIGEDENWCGHHFAQSNWYAFGRLAWNPQIESENIATEWLIQTMPELAYSGEGDAIRKMMMDSREVCVDYMMPMGLHHIFAWDHHYGPEPWCEIDGARADWLPKYYHNANEKGLGFDRTTKTGSGAVEQYFSPLRETYNEIKTCPEELILWFHHVDWDYRMQNGLTMWENLCRKYDSGVQRVREFQQIWDRAEPYVDAERFAHVQSRLRTQMRDAIWWRDACLLYFQTFSKRPIPHDLERPMHDLEELKKIKLDMKHHN